MHVKNFDSPTLSSTFFREMETWRTPDREEDKRRGHKKFITFISYEKITPSHWQHVKMLYINLER